MANTNYTKETASFDVWYREFKKEFPITYKKITSKYLTLRLLYGSGKTVEECALELRKPFTNNH